MRSVLADMRSVAGVEQVAANVYSRTFEHGWLAARRDPKASQVVVDVCIDSIHAVRGLIIQMRRLLDLDCEPQTIERHLGALAVARPGVRLPGAFGGFELAVRAVLGQQVTVIAATTLAGRFAQRLSNCMPCLASGLGLLTTSRCEFSVGPTAFLPPIWAL
jgi:AraC family transcriptional regulator, regulatory protein of adaptative response / DNA-3-methyladenine glycosylase II